MNDTATPEELLLYLTRVLRGEIHPGAAEMKAVELLGKRCGLFSEERDALPTPIIVDDIACMSAEPNEKEADPT